ncbi:MAG: hypothetical protein IMZ61_11575 [Planctomycetes bacterium]|nr:hypothetical protein [Planctomycetota bacterium]
MNWIPIKDPPPMELEHVLITIDGPCLGALVMEAFCRFNSPTSKQRVVWFKQDGSGLDNDQRVTAWQPMPEAFK